MIIAAHRGLHTVAAENSLRAFEEAIACGAEMIEFDVRRTLDGQYVVHHDDHVRGVPLHRLSLEALRKARHRPPTLQEALQCCRDRVRLDIEIKEPGYEREIIDLAWAHFAAEKLLFTSFIDSVVYAVKEYRPEARAGLLIGSGRPRPRMQFADLFPFGRARRCRADLILPNQLLLRRGLLNRAAARGLGVMVWTVNRESRLRQLLHDERIAGIITDDPVLALRLRDEPAAAARM